MSENLPQKHKESFFSRIKNIFKIIFKNDFADPNNYDEIWNLRRNNTSKESPINQLKTSDQTIHQIEQNNGKKSEESLNPEIKRKIEQEKLINQLIGNPKLFENWPAEKLLRLEKICDEKIAKYDDEIAAMTNINA